MMELFDQEILFSFFVGMIFFSAFFGGGIQNSLACHIIYLQGLKLQGTAWSLPWRLPTAMASFKKMFR
jgi:hypothetical protein